VAFTRFKREMDEQRDKRAKEAAPVLAGTELD